MELAYTIVLFIHLFCAIIFIGYVFADVIVTPSMNKVLRYDDVEKAKNAMSAKARKIFPLSVLTLVLTGGFMFSKYVNSNVGLFETNLQYLLWIKFLLAMLIVCGIVYSLSCKLLKKQPMSMMKHFHKLVLVLGIIIVFIAKFMFIV